MTFTTRIKEEISKQDCNNMEGRSILSAYLRYNSSISDKEISITLENASVTRFIYKLLKEVFLVSPRIIVRNQKRFRIKQIYILIINERIDYILNILDLNNSKLNLDSDEEKIAFLKGTFLACGSISNPSTSGYHLEFILDNLKYAKEVSRVLNYFKLSSKIVKRTYKEIVYIKSSENISDLIKRFKAINSLFEFEDIRIYRDHKNMVNRLNNCELANQTKTISTGIKQIEEIEFAEKHDLIPLLDEKTKVIIDYRKKYPESSFQELADIISLETDYKIGKSGINHHFIKIKQLVEKYKNNN